VFGIPGPARVQEQFECHWRSELVGRELPLKIRRRHTTSAENSADQQALFRMRMRDFPHFGEVFGGTASESR
jgi:hypothetical protein